MELDLTFYRQRTQIGRAKAQLADELRFVGLFGPSGAGKTTLLRGIAGLFSGCDGLFQWGEVIANREQRGDIGMVLQTPVIFPGLSVEQQLKLVAKHAKRQWCSVDEVIDNLGLRSIAGSFAEALSGGEKQRVAIARAVLAGPHILLLDEPVSALDDRAKYQVLTWLKSLVHKANIRILFVSHQLDDLVSYCESLLLMEQGSIIAAGNVDDVISLHNLRHRDHPLVSILEGELVSKQQSLYQIRIGEQSVLRKYCTVSANSSVANFMLDAERIVVDRSALPHTSLLNALAVNIRSIDHLSADRRLVIAHTGDNLIKVALHQRSIQTMKLKAGERVTLRFDVE